MNKITLNDTDSLYKPVMGEGERERERETLRKTDLFLGKVSKEKDELLPCQDVSQGDWRARRDNSEERHDEKTDK